MKNIFAFLILSVMVHSAAQAQNCTINLGPYNQYTIYSKTPTTIDVVSDSVGWLTELNPSRSTGSTRYFQYKDQYGNLNKELSVQGNQISFYDFEQQRYYFQNMPCGMTVTIGSKAPAQNASSLRATCSVEDVLQDGKAIPFVVDGNGRPVKVTVPYRNEPPEDLTQDPQDPNHYLGRDHGDFQTHVRVRPDGSFTLQAVEESGGSLCR